MEKRTSSIRDGQDVTSVLTAQHEHAIIDKLATEDEKILGALGYKQEFKRDFTLWESFSVSFSCLGLLPSIASTIGYSLGYSGTGGAIWGWLAAAVCTQATAFSLAELSSSMPTTGGLYYAAAVLAPPGWGPLASWLVGWSNFCGYVTAPCSVSYALASMLVTCGEIAHPDYVAETWQVYLIFLLLLVVQGFLTTQSTKFIGRMNKVGTVYNVVLVLIFVIWFPLGSINTPKTTPSREVWTTFENGTDWPVGWSTIMGFLTVLWTMAGYDVPFHLSEECSNAPLATPRAIILTAQSGLYLGLALILVIAYTVQSIPDVLTTAQPFGSLCLQVLGPNAGLAMFALTMAALFFSAQGVVLTAARIMFAFARDGALPGSRWWRRVDARSRTPVLATWGVLGASAVLGLLMFAGPVAIGAVFSIGAIAQYTSFTVPIMLLLFFDHGRFQRGPWHLGKWSKPTHAMAVAWYVLIVPALCFPAAKGANLTLSTMNWTCLIYGGVIFLALVYYAVSARKWFKGPRVNVEHVRRVHGARHGILCEVTASSSREAIG